MFETAAAKFRQFLACWTAWVRRLAALILLAAAFGTAATAFYVSENLGINTDTTDMLSPDLPFRQHSRALSEAFPQFSDNILVVVEGQTADLADDWTLSLASRLRANPKLYGSIYDPQGDAFFRRNGLLYLDTGELAELSDRLAEAQPFLGALYQDPSLRGLLQMLDLAVGEILKGGSAGLEIGSLLNAVAAVVEGEVAGRPRHLSWQALMSGEQQTDGVHRRFLLIQPALDFGSLQPASDAIDGLRATAKAIGLEPTNGVRLRLTGSAALAQEELKSVEDGMGLAAVLSLVLVTGLLFGGLGSPRLALSILATLIMGLIWTAGFATWAVGTLNLISVAFAVLFIGLSVDFGIHYGLRHKESLDGGADPDTALEAASTGTGGALSLSAVAAAIGFYAFLPTDYRGLAELGLIAGSGMFIALFANMTVLPALLILFPLTPSQRRSDPAFIAKLSEFFRTHARRVIWVAVVLGMAAALLVPRARFDFDPLNLKDPQTESVSVLFDLMQEPDANPYSITVLAGSLTEAQTTAAKLSKLPEVRSVRTVADYLPADQDEKLDMIGSMALFLVPALSLETVKKAPGSAQIEQGIAGLKAKLRLSDSKAAGRLAAALEAFKTTNPEDLKALERRLLSGFPGRLQVLRQSLKASPVTLDDLPRDLWVRQVAGDGRAKIEVFPKADMRDRAALDRFVVAVRTLAPHATGSPVVILEAGNTVVKAFRDAGLLAAVAIALLVVILLRRLRAVLLVFAPLILAALLTVALSVVFNLPFNFANIIVLPLLFGLGIASGIHLVMRDGAEQAGQEGGSNTVMATSTPRAVIFSALTTIGSFGSIALSSHPGTASMGILLTIAITLTLVSTLTVLPALLALDGGGKK